MGVGTVVWILRGAAALSAAPCLLWLLGATGTGWLFAGPESMSSAAQHLDAEAAGGHPTFPVRIEEEVWEDLVDEDAYFNSSDGYSVPGAFAEFSVRWQVVAWEPTLLQRGILLALQCLLSLGIAWLWWSLSTLVASSRRDDPFTLDNARRVRWMGLLLVVGGPAYAVLTRLVHGWLLADSELADRASMVAAWWADFPWWSGAVGLALLALASVWRRGAAMRHDLEGLV